MQKQHKFILGVLVTASLLAPLSSYAVGIPIGGMVTSVVPCPHAAGYLYTVVGAGIGSGVFWYFPGVITYPFGPPTIGRWVLGLAAPAGACGLATILEGTSKL